MKSPDFEYLKAKNIEQVFASLHTYKDTALILAGGQSLLAMMNLRMANPQILIDISGIDVRLDSDSIGGHDAFLRALLHFGYFDQLRFERFSFTDILEHLCLPAIPTRFHGMFLHGIGHRR